MPHNRSPPVVATFLLLCGIIGSSLASLDFEWGHATTLGPRWMLYQLGASIALVVLGGIWAIVRLSRRPEAEPEIMAHESFKKKVRHQVPIPEAPVMPGPSGEPQSPQDAQIRRLDLTIRDVSRRINRATVMLGTGKLSQDGYKTYVESLKKERADLEGEKVRLQLRQRK